MRGFNKVLLSAVVATLCVGCADTEFDSPTSGDKISFLTATYDTRAASYNPDNKGANYITTMGVYAAATSSADYDETQHAINLFDQGTKVSRPDVKGEWTYGGTEYWPVGKTTFFGYSPYDANGTNISTPAVGAPNITFNVATHPADQVDLLIANPQKNKTKADRVVIMPFKHALTKISFAAKLSHDPSATPHFDWAKISRIEVKGVYTQGTHSMDAATEWQNLAVPNTANTPFAVSIENEADNDLLNGGLKNIELTTQYQQITADDGYLFMLPQSLKGKRPNDLYAKIKVYIMTDMDGPTDSDMLFQDPIEFMLELTGLDWKQGEAINYMINVDITDHITKNSTIEAQPVEWDNVTVNGQIVNRQLNVTRIDVNTFDGAITRVHFWSDQPHVWIDSKLYAESTSTPYLPGADEGKVNDLFNNIAQEPSENNPPLTSVLNFEYDPVTGKGYFDLDKRTGKADKKLIINLCASNQAYDPSFTKPLRRSIRLKTYADGYPTAGNITTPYVGTFHRHTEVGERIITWNNQGTWTAVLMDTPCEDARGYSYDDYKNVLIDRTVSPAIEMGILYTDNPGDAENYKVSNFDPNWCGTTSTNINDPYTGAKRWVSGTDKLYLRVGWRQTNPYYTTRNRYAIINIYDGILTASDIARIGTGNNEPTLKTTLYVRQGESDDYIMRNDGYSYDGTEKDTYKGQAAGKPRTYSVKFSTYDITDRNRTMPSSLQYNNFSELGDNGGVYVPFPTNGGYYFRWGETRALKTNKSQAISGMPIGPATSYSDVCPPNYRIPKYSVTGSSFSYLDRANEDLTLQSEVVSSLVHHPLDWNTTPGGGYPSNDGWWFAYDYNGRSHDNANKTDYRKANWVFGYYADGFFDRGKIGATTSGSMGEGYSEVSYSVGGNLEDGFSGFLMFNPNSLSSVFFPASGYLEASGGLKAAGGFAFYGTQTTTTNGEPYNICTYYFNYSINPLTKLFLISPSNNTKSIFDSPTQLRAAPVRCVTDY